MAIIKVFNDIFEDKSEDFIYDTSRPLLEQIEEHLDKDYYKTTMVECYDPDTKQTFYAPMEDEVDNNGVLIIVNGQSVDKDYVPAENDIVNVLFTPLGGTNTTNGTALGVLVGATLGVLTAAALVLFTPVFVSTGLLLSLVIPSAFVGGLVGYGIGRTLDKAASAGGRVNGKLESNQQPDVRGCSNQSLVGNNFPFVIGKHLTTPFIVGDPYTEYGGERGENAYIRELLCVGYGPLKLTDFKIGDFILAYNRSHNVLVPEYETMPVSPTEGMIVKYTGTTGTYINGSYYKYTSGAWVIDTDYSTVTGGTEVAKTNLIAGLLKGYSSGGVADNGDIADYWSKNDVEVEILQQPADAEVRVIDPYFQDRTKINLARRPLVPAETMNQAGWDVPQGEICTILSHAASNQAETVTILTTPINPDGSVLTPNELYAIEDAILNDGGEYPDNLLATFYGADSIAQSEDYAQALHEDQEQYYFEKNCIGYGSTYTEVTKEQQVDANSFYICDKQLDETAQVTYKGVSFPNLFRTNTVILTEACPRQFTINIDFPSGLYRTRSVTTDSSTEVVYDKITMWMCIQWRVYNKNNAPSDATGKDYDKWNTVYFNDKVNRLFDNVSPGPGIAGQQDFDKSLHQGNDFGNKTLADIYQDFRDRQLQSFYNYSGLDGVSEMRFSATVSLTKEQCQQVIADTNPSRCIEIRVIRVSPNYMNETSDAGHQKGYGMWSYSDHVKVSTVVTRTFDYLALRDNDELKPVRPVSENDLKKLCLVAIKAKADNSGYLQNNVDSISCIAESFSPVWDKTAKKILPEGIHKVRKYYGYFEHNTDNPCNRTNDADEREVTKSEYEEARHNGYNWYMEKAGSNFADLIKNIVFTNKQTINGIDGWLLPSAAEKYNENLASSGFLLGAFGIQNGPEGVGLEDTNVLSIGEWSETIEALEDGSWFEENTEYNGVQYTKGDLIPVRYEANAYIYGGIKIEDLLQKLAFCGRAAWVIDESGKIKIVFDGPVAYTKGAISAENCISSGNSFSYEEPPAGLFITFHDENDGYENNSFYAWSDGNSSERHHGRVEPFSADYVTNNYQMWALSRYSLACRIQNKEVLTRKIGPGGMIYSLGDVLLIQGRDLLIGEVSGRIQEVIEANGIIYGFVTDAVYEYTAELDESGNSVQGVTVIQPSYMGKSNAVTLPLSAPRTVTITETVGTRTINRDYKLQKGQTNIVLFGKIDNVYGVPRDTSEDPSVTSDIKYNFKTGDTVLFGLVDKTAAPYRITKIKPEAGGKFTETLVPYDESLYNYGAALPTFQSYITPPVPMVDHVAVSDVPTTLAEQNDSEKSIYLTIGDSDAKFIEIAAYDGLVFKNHLPASIELSTIPTGFTPTSYKWYKDDVLISGATSSSLTINYSDTAAGVYKVEADDTYIDIVTVISVEDSASVPVYSCEIIPKVLTRSSSVFLLGKEVTVYKDGVETTDTVYCKYRYEKFSSFTLTPPRTNFTWTNWQTATVTNGNADLYPLNVLDIPRGWQVQIYSDNQYTDLLCSANYVDGVSSSQWLITDVASVNVDDDGNFNPSYVNLSAKQSCSTENGAYAGRFKVEYSTVSDPDENDWSVDYTSSSDESDYSYQIPSGTKCLRCTLYQAGGTSSVLDQDIVTISKDAKPVYAVDISNQNFSIVTEQDLKPTTTEAQNTHSVVITAYKGATLLDVVAPSATLAPNQFKFATPTASGFTITQTTPGTLVFATNSANAIPENSNITVTVQIYGGQTITKTISVSASKTGPKGNAATTYEIDCPMVFKKGETVTFTFYKVENGTRTSATVYHNAEWTENGTTWTSFAASQTTGSSFTTTALNSSIKVRCSIKASSSATTTLDLEYSSLVSDGIAGTSATNVYLGNENITLACDKDGKLKSAYSSTIKVGAYTGTTRKASTITKTSQGNTNLVVGTITNGTAQADGLIPVSMAQGDVATAGEIVFSVVANGITFSKSVNVSVAKDGEDGEDGTKTFTSDQTRSWSDAQWTDYSTPGRVINWNNSTVEGMRVDDILAIPATLTGQGNIIGVVYARITSIPTTQSGGIYAIPSVTLYGQKGNRGQTGATGTRGTLTFIGTEIFSIKATETAYTLTTASTGITSNTMAIIVGDRYVNSLTYDVWKCTTAGTASTAKWTYEGRQTEDKDTSNQFRFFGDGTRNKYNKVSANHTQSVVVSTDPFGNQSELLEITVANNKALSRYGTFVPYYKAIKVDSTYTYRYACYYKRNQTGQGLVDRIGILGYANPHTKICTLDGSSFTGWGGAMNSYSSSYNNKWILIVGYIVGSGQTQVPTNDESGIYDVATGQKLANATNRRWVEGVTEVIHGAVILYEENASVTTTSEYISYIYDIRFDRCDGTEPSLNELLNLDTSAKGKGTWASGQNYFIGNIVYYTDGCSYICKTNHTSSSSILPTNTTYWDKLADKGDSYSLDVSCTGSPAGTLSVKLSKNGADYSGSWYSDVFNMATTGTSYTQWTSLSTTRNTASFTGTYSASKAFKVIAYTDSSKTTVLCAGQCSYGLKGDAGVDSLSCDASISSVDIATGTDLKPTTGSSVNIVITAFKGTTALTATTGTPSASQFKVTTPSNLTGITFSQSVSGTQSIITATWTNTTVISANASATINIAVGQSANNFTKVVKFSAVQKGNTGDRGYSSKGYKLYYASGYTYCKGLASDDTYSETSPSYVVYNGTTYSVGRESNNYARTWDNTTVSSGKKASGFVAFLRTTSVSVWSGSQSYRKGCVVSYGTATSSVYICITAHTSSSSITPTNTSYWVPANILNMYYSYSEDKWQSILTGTPIYSGTSTTPLSTDIILIGKFKSTTATARTVSEIDPINAMQQRDILVNEITYRGIVGTTDLNTYTSRYYVLDGNTTFTQESSSADITDIGTLVIKRGHTGTTGTGTSDSNQCMQICNGYGWETVGYTGTGTTLSLPNYLQKCQNMAMMGLVAMAKVYSANNVTLPKCCGQVFNLLIANNAFIGNLISDSAFIRQLTALDINFKNSVSSYKDSNYEVGDLAISMGKNPKNSSDNINNFIIQSYKKTIQGGQIWNKEFYTKKNDEGDIEVNVNGHLNLVGEISSFSPDLYAGADLQELEISGTGLNVRDYNSAYVYYGGYIYLFQSNSNNAPLLVTRAIYGETMNFEQVAELSSIGLIYDAIVYKGEVYLSFSTGLYKYDITNNTTTLITSVYKPYYLQEINGLLNISCFVSSEERNFAFYDGTTITTQTVSTGANYDLSIFTDGIYTTCNVPSSDSGGQFSSGCGVCFYDKNFVYLGFNLIADKPITMEDGTIETVALGGAIFSSNGKLFATIKTDTNKNRYAYSDDCGDSWKAFTASGYTQTAFVAGFRFYSYKSVIIIKNETGYLYSLDGGQKFNYKTYNSFSSYRNGSSFIIKDTYYQDILIPTVKDGWLTFDRIRQINVAKGVVAQKFTSDYGYRVYANGLKILWGYCTTSGTNVSVNFNSLAGVSFSGRDSYFIWLQDCEDTDPRTRTTQGDTGGYDYVIGVDQQYTTYFCASKASARKFYWLAIGH